MKIHTMKVFLLALCLAVPFSLQAEIVMKAGATYSTTEDKQPYRVYMDLGNRQVDSPSDPNGIREGYVLVNNEIASTVQYGWPSFREVFKLVIQTGTATWYIGEGASQSVNSVPYTGTSNENALFIALHSQSIMNQYSPTRGIEVGITNINGQDIQNGVLSAKFSYPSSGATAYGAIYGFTDVNNLTVNGWVNIINPSSSAAPYDYAFQIGTGHLDPALVPEPSALTLSAACLAFTWFYRRR